MVPESPRGELPAQRLSEFAVFCADMGAEMSMVDIQPARLELSSLRGRILLWLRIRSSTTLPSAGPLDARR
eukprot:683605-Alexandrium_andersonii.AAC.1